MYVLRNNAVNYSILDPLGHDQLYSLTVCPDSGVHGFVICISIPWDRNV